MSKNQDAVEDFFTTEMIYREIHEIEGLNLNIPIIVGFISISEKCPRLEYRAMMYFPNSGGYNPKLDIIPKVEAEGKTIDDACVGLIEKLVEYHSFLVEAESFETQNPDYIMHKKYLDLIMVKEQE